MRPLINKLSRYNDKHIYIYDYDVHRLRFLLPEVDRNYLHILPDMLEGKNKAPIGSLVVLYKSENKPYPPRMGVYGIKVAKKPELSTAHYEVFKVIERKN